MPPRSRLTRGIDGFADDAVHAGEGADVDDAGRRLFAPGRRPCRRSAPFRRRRPRAAGRGGRIPGSRRYRALRGRRNPRGRRSSKACSSRFCTRSRTQAPSASRVHAAARQLELAEALGIGVPDPFDDIGEPGFGAVFFEAAHQVFVGESIQAAEDFADDADQRQGAVAADARAAEAVARSAPGRRAALSVARAARPACFRWCGKGRRGDCFVDRVRRRPASRS